MIKKIFRNEHILAVVTCGGAVRVIAFRGKYVEREFGGCSHDWVAYSDLADMPDYPDVTKPGVYSWDGHVEVRPIPDEKRDMDGDRDVVTFVGVWRKLPLPWPWEKL